MKSCSLSQVDDHILLHDLVTLASQDCGTTAVLLAHIGEVEERKLYAREGYSSMFLYCVRVLHMSEDVALARIRAARKARQFPAIFPALADGRLNITAVLLLAGHLTPETADGLLEAAAHKTKGEIRLLLAQRFPRPDLPTDELSVRTVEAADFQFSLGTVVASAPELVPERVVPSASQLVPERPARARLTPLSPGRVAWQVTVDQETQDVLRYVQSLLGHSVPSGDVATVLKLSLNLMAQHLEQRKLAQARKRLRSEAAAAAPAAAAGVDVAPYLRKLGLTAEEARQGAALCADITDAPLEKRVVVALRGLAPPCVRRIAPVGMATTLAPAGGGAS